MIKLYIDLYYQVQIDINTKKFIFKLGNIIIKYK